MCRSSVRDIHIKERLHTNQYMQKENTIIYTLLLFIICSNQYETYIDKSMTFNVMYVQNFLCKRVVLNSIEVGSGQA